MTTASLREFLGFDFEQQLLDCWHVTTDINALVHGMEHDLSEDEIINVLIGLKGLYELKFNKLFQMYETALKQLKP